MLAGCDERIDSQMEGMPQIFLRTGGNHETNERHENDGREKEALEIRPVFCARHSQSTHSWLDFAFLFSRLSWSLLFFILVSCRVLDVLLSAMSISMGMSTGTAIADNAPVPAGAAIPAGGR